MNDKIPKILEYVRNKIENSDDNIKHIIEQQGNDYVRFWKKTAKGIGALSLLILVVGIWQTATMIFVEYTPEALQSSTSLLAAQTTDMPVTDTPILHHHDDKPTTITNNNTENTVQTIINHNHTATPSQSSGTVDTAVDDTTTMNTDTILQLQTDWQKYETNYLACADISSDNMTSYCSSKCTAEYINQAVCEIINCI